MGALGYSARVSGATASLAVGMVSCLSEQLPVHHLRLVAGLEAELLVEEVGEGVVALGDRAA
jgi:hypothetical protein